MKHIKSIDYAFNKISLKLPLKNKFAINETVTKWASFRQFKMCI